ncbi:MAG TPA: hypothetical protein VF177_15240 [Anaerolineae bacterium]
MLDITQEENRRLKDELNTLRQAIIQVEPAVVVDGRFERMIISPLAVIEVARELIEKIPQLQYQEHYIRIP